MSLDASQQRGRMVCSGKGCRAEAAYGLLWNNPKLHTPERRKTWLACEEHREFLAYFLSARGFLKDTVPVSQLPDEPQEAHEG
jgi:hypothetical protein